MKIDLTLNFSHPDAVSTTIRYGRIDNIALPTYQTITGILSSPYSISNIDNGQYRVYRKPVYADGRTCEETYSDSPPCDSIISLNAEVNGNNIEVTYVAPGDVPQVRLTINYPNGGSFKQSYTNGANGSTIIVPIPANVFGDYLVYMQSVCDPDTNFYSPLSPPVTVNVPSTTQDNYTLSASFNFSIEYVVGSGVPNLGSTGTNGTKSGVHTAMSGVYQVNVLGTIVLATKLDAFVNNILVDCIAVTASGTYSLTITAAADDLVIIAIDSGTC